MAQEIKIACRGCHSKFDVSDLPPFSEFPCPECGLMLRTPKPFGKYLLEKRSGGGMGTVYRAIDPLLARRVAVKIIKSKPDGDDHGFLKAARLFANISHPAVLPVFDCGVEGEYEYIAMQFMDCGDLEKMMKAHTLPAIPVLANWLSRIAEGLLFLNGKQGIVHHDIKPSNILLNSHEDIKLADFDLAGKVDDPEVQQIAATYASPGYVSPERLHNGIEDRFGDIFSFGVTAYELFTYHPPYPLKGEAEELYLKRQEPVCPPGIINTDIPEALSKMILRMLSFFPEDRPQWEEIIEIFRHIAEQQKEK